MSRWLKVVLVLLRHFRGLYLSVGVAQCGAEGGMAVCCQGHLRRTRCVFLLAHRLWQEFVLPNTTLRHELQTFTNSAGDQGKGQCYHFVSPLVTLMEDQVSGLRKHGPWGEGLHHHFFSICDKGAHLHRRKSSHR